MPVIEATSNLVAELRTARAESDRLFSILTTDGLYERPIAERHRVIFYIGHLDGFDSIQICREGLGLKSPDPELDDLFQAGIDPDSSQLPKDQPQDWPSLEEIKRYATRCRQRVDEHLEAAPEELVCMIVEHRQMHLETLAYMFHNFDYKFKHVALAAPLERIERASPNNPWITIPAGEAILGRPEGGTFGWDNEYGETRRQVPAFGIQQNSVTNGEYLRFVEAGAPMPHFWRRRGDRIYYRGMFEEVPLPLDWPVYVSFNEAEAYAKSIGKRIASEEQFHRAAYGGCDQAEYDQAEYPWGNEEPSAQHGNFDLRRWDPEPVDATPKGASAFGVHQLVGNGWQWTSTPFAPFPGFHARASYPGYSANFFDGEHYVLKGGSPRTASRLLRRSFRNWFRRDYPYMYAAFRCVEN